MPSILILDMSYTLGMFRDRNLMEALESRKLGGYFQNVISVHPLAGLFFSGDERYGAPKITSIDAHHLFIEGKLGRYKWLRFLPPINFILSQFNLIFCILLYARKNSIEIIRIGDPYYLGIIGVILKYILKIPLVIRVCFRYDEVVRATGKPVMPRLFLFRFIEKIIERKVFERCDLNAGANEDNMLYGIENGARKNCSTIFRYGNLIHKKHWLDPAERKNCDEFLHQFNLLDIQFLITVSRFDPVKYIEHTVLVLAELLRRGHVVKAVIVGDGPTKNQIEKLAENLGVTDSLILCGNQNQEWIADILPRASIIISPHMGRALTEAALAGVPIVAYDYDWQREVVINDVTGYLVPHKDWLGMSDMAERLLKNNQSAKWMGQNARKKVFDMMNPNKLEKHEIAEYEKLLSN